MQKPKQKDWKVEDDFLNLKTSLVFFHQFRYLSNLQRAFEAGITSSAVYLSPKIYHIGTPSDRPTSEGQCSVMELHQFHLIQHHLQSPVSFGSSTPVQSASAAPLGLQSSLGGMFDVESTLTLPELLLRDPLRIDGRILQNIFE